MIPLSARHQRPHYTIARKHVPWHRRDTNIQAVRRSLRRACFIHHYTKNDQVTAVLFLFLYSDFWKIFYDVFLPTERTTKRPSCLGGKGAVIRRPNDPNAMPNRRRGTSSLPPSIPTSRWKILDSSTTTKMRRKRRRPTKKETRLANPARNLPKRKPPRPRPHQLLDHSLRHLSLLHPHRTNHHLLLPRHRRWKARCPWMCPWTRAIRAKCRRANPSKMGTIRK